MKIYGPPPPRELTYAEIACTASHIYGWQMALNDAADWSIFIEDDAIFENDFFKNLNTILFNVPNYADVLFIGGGYPHEEVSLTLGKVGNFIIKHHPATNTAVGYAIRNRVLKKLLRFDHFDLPIDYEFAYLLQINNCIVIHMENYGISEGSKYYYKSSIR